MKTLLLFSITVFGGNALNAQQTKPVVTMTVTSQAFHNDSTIPKRFSCEGENISPKLSWSGTPHGTKSFALVCEDPDAPRGTFIHWVIYNIPASVTKLPENIPQQITLPDGTMQGYNGANKIGYTGPCPPPGKVHHYHFRLLALGVVVNLSGNVTHDLLLSTIQGHILGQGELVGTYIRN